MIENPGAQLAEYVQAGADIITVHVDTGDDTPSFLRELGKMENVNDRELGIVRAAAINPDVPVEALKPLLDDIEMISVLAVNARIKGFPFFDSIRERFAEVKEMVAGAGRDILLSIDGGVKRGNIVDIARFGADIVTSGSAIFDGKAAAENARFMLNAVKAQAEQGSV
jgi:ribulose-phosphate 3-epimerase